MRPERTHCADSWPRRIRYQHLNAIKKCGSAFTLIELLVVLSIMVVVMTAIIACIAGGIRVWDTARSFDMIEAKAVIAIRIFEKDVMRTFRFYRQPFKGETDTIRFPGRVAGSSLDGDGIPSGGLRIGSIEYRHDRQTHRLIRVTSIFPDDVELEETILENVKSLELNYYETPVPEVSEGGWQAEWSDATNFPERVRITLALSEGSSSLDVERVIFPVVSTPEKGAK